MTHPTLGSSPQSSARLAGFLYLIVILAGLFVYAYVRGQMFVRGDAAATANNILANEQLYRWGFVVGVVLLVCNVPLAVILCRLFTPASRDLSLLLAFFVLTGNVIESVNLLNHFAPLIVLKDPHHFSAFDPAQLQVLAYMSFRAFDLGFGFCLVFFAFFDFLIGYLIFLSRFLPRTLGALIAISGLCYLTNSVVYFLAPQIAGYLYPYILLPCFVAETSLSLWLLLRGIDLTMWKAATEGQSAAEQRR